LSNMEGLALGMGYVSYVGYGAIGAGIALGIDIFIAPAISPSPSNLKQQGKS